MGSAKARKVCAAFEQDKTGLVVTENELPVVRSIPNLSNRGKDRGTRREKISS